MILNNPYSTRRFLLGGVFLLLNACGSGGETQGSNPPPAGQARLSVEQSPFQLVFRNPQGETVLASMAAAPGQLPGPVSITDATFPNSTLGQEFMYAPFGWIVGLRSRTQIPASLFQGNQLTWIEAGSFFAVTGVDSIERSGQITTLTLATNTLAGDTATLVIEAQPNGTQKLSLSPPASIAPLVSSTVFALESPPDEGLYGLGARKDHFNQRGHLRNVWTEQQNTGTGVLTPGLAAIGQLNDVFTALGGTALNIPLPTRGIDEDYSFPNGGQGAYWVEAALFGSRGWAAWVQQTDVSRIDLAVGRSNILRWLVASPELTVYFNANGLEDASRAYTAEQGRPPAPPRYAYMPWFDTLNQGEGEAAPNGQGFTGGERARFDIETFIAMRDAENIPIRVIGIEGWQVIPQGGRQCQSRELDAICAAFDDAVTFEDCDDASGKPYFQQVRDLGFTLTGYWNMFHTDPNQPSCARPDGACSDSPGVPAASKRAFYEARDNNLFVKDARDPTGNTDYQIITNRGGVSFIIDFTHPDAQAFWSRQLARQFDLGIEGFMHDFGELTIQGMQFAGGATYRGETVQGGTDIDRLHNLYPLLYHQAARAAIDDYAQAHPELAGEIEPFFFARAGYTGAGAFTSSVFPGDETTDFTQATGLPSIIPTMLNLSLTGLYSFTTDVGGYFDTPVLSPRTTKQLFIRWSQAAALMPIMRLHSSTFSGSVFPWTFDDETIDIFNRYARLKLNLVDLVDRHAREAASNGHIGPVRPLILEDDSPEARSIDDQWLLGEDILVAPVITENAASRSVYFPQGSDWMRVNVGSNGQFVPTGDVFSGGSRETVPVTLADIPLFLRR